MIEMQLHYYLVYSW